MARAVRVLVVDDSPEVCSLLSIAFGLRDDVEVVGVGTDGQEAVDLAARLQPDLVLLDLSLPRVDGRAALPQIRRVAPRAKVVLHSAFSPSFLVDDVIDLSDADGQVEKGTTPSELARVIVGVAGG